MKSAITGLLDSILNWVLCTAACVSVWTAAQVGSDKGDAYITALWWFFPWVLLSVANVVVSDK